MSTMNRVSSILLAGLLMVSISACKEDGTDFVKVKVGHPAPKSDNLTAAADNWYTVSTMDTKVPLYSKKIADLINDGKPFLAVFGTPQHCTMCVDQIVRVAVMKEQYGDRFDFVHIDGYKDNKVWVEWGVTGEPWTYFVDRAGIVRTILPGQTELGLLEFNIEQLLNDNS